VNGLRGIGLAFYRGYFSTRRRQADIERPLRRPEFAGQRNHLEFPPSAVGKAVLGQKVRFVGSVGRVVASLPFAAIRLIPAEYLKAVSVLRVVGVWLAHGFIPSRLLLVSW
jgi:hypothetical protein